MFSVNLIKLFVHETSRRPFSGIHGLVTMLLMHHLSCLTFLRLDTVSGTYAYKLDPAQTPEKKIKQTLLKIQNKLIQMISMDLPTGKSI